LGKSDPDPNQIVSDPQNCEQKATPFWPGVKISDSRIVPAKETVKLALFYAMLRRKNYKFVWL
jgi:hypothetical protein